MTKLEIFAELLESLSAGEKERFVHLVHMPKIEPLSVPHRGTPTKRGGGHGPTYRAAEGGSK